MCRKVAEGAAERYGWLVLSRHVVVANHIVLVVLCCAVPDESGITALLEHDPLGDMVCKRRKDTHPYGERDDVQVPLLFIHRFAHNLHIGLDGWLITSLNHLHLVLVLHLKVKSMWASSCENASHVGHVVGWNVGADFTLERLHITMFSSVLAAEVSHH